MRQKQLSSLVPDPRLTIATPYLNVKPEVRYLGDAACAACHGKITQSYKHHPMGRSLEPMDRLTPIEAYDSHARNPFMADGIRHSVVLKPDGTYHREETLGPDQQVVIQCETRVDLAVGSGRRGRSYLIVKDQQLFQSSITWYASKRAWDLSPGYDQKHAHFDRKIDARCLFCHTNFVEPEPNTINAYRPPMFQGHAIGCERCHGPGELHVQRVEQGEGYDQFDPTIVNPKHLAPMLRESVCQQCHLEGEVRLLRRGRQPFDFRPGLPLWLFWSTYNNVSKDHEIKFVGHPEQMRESRCFTGSKGQLGCISCHDPHALPEPEKKVAFYKQRCLVCHAGNEPQHAGCALPEPKRLAMSPQDDCIQCHMPKAQSKDVAHTSISDHHIPRWADRPPITHKKMDGEWLRYFHQTEVDAHILTEEERQRDMGMALMELVSFEDLSNANNQQVARLVSQRALKLLDEACTRWPDDGEARRARSHALWVLGREADALEEIELALRMEPNNERWLVQAARLAMSLRRWPVAQDYWLRVLKVNQHDPQYHADLGLVFFQQQDWARARERCEQALQLSPMHQQARRLLISCFLQLQDRTAAQREFDRLLSLKPADAAALREWFTRQRQ